MPGKTDEEGACDSGGSYRERYSSRRGRSRPPPGYTWSLALLYLVTAVAVALLYAACRWYARVKRESRSP